MSEPLRLHPLVGSLVESVSSRRRWPRGLYVHVPYCVAKCPYCDFNSYAFSDPGQLDEMVEAILQEAEQWAALLEGGRGGFRTLFVGGGTPTVLRPAQLRRLVVGLRERLPLSDLEEATIEANPGTLTLEKLEALREAGIDRVSVGVQSLQPEELRRLGRIHTAEQAVRSVAMIRRAGFARFNLDVMVAIPGQTAESLRRTLDRLVGELGARHVSAYVLTLEASTPFFEAWRRGELPMADEETQARMVELVVSTLAGAGLERYEVSNFARPGEESKHNLGYWRHQTYLGLGPGAHSFWAGFRFASVRAPAAYVRAVRPGGATAGSAVGFIERLSLRQWMDERILLGLRIAEGVDRERFARELGYPLEEAYDARVWDRLEAGGLIRRDGRTVRLTDRGFLVADAVAVAITASARPLPGEAEPLLQGEAQGEPDEDVGADPAAGADQPESQFTGAPHAAVEPDLVAAAHP